MRKQQARALISERITMHARELGRLHWSGEVTPSLATHHRAALDKLRTEALRRMQGLRAVRFHFEQGGE